MCRRTDWNSPASGTNRNGNTMTVALETRSGEAGHSGTDVRSDLHVHIEPRDRGGIAIELQSRVKPYYGDSIQRQAEEVLEALGVRHAQTGHLFRSAQL